MTSATPEVYRAIAAIGVSLIEFLFKFLWYSLVLWLMNHWAGAILVFCFIFLNNYLPRTATAGKEEKDGE